MKKNFEKEKNLIQKQKIFFFLIALCLSNCSFWFIHHSQEQDLKMNARYIAEDTVRKIETQIARYMENSDLFKNMISSGKEITDDEFNHLAQAMIQNKSVVEAYELAPAGVVKQVYPSKGNEEAYGLNMLELPERKREAILAKNSENYTIAGPYPLKQGGVGALIFDPIYTQNIDGDKEFWGFAITVINWDAFLQELQLDKMDEAGYEFVVWKKDSDDQLSVLMQSGNESYDDLLVVECEVPNDTWYFGIAKKNGWIPLYVTLTGIFLSVLISLLVTLWFSQMKMRHLQEEEYADNIEKAMKKAQMASESKTRFLFNMSHDIRTPMNAIVGYTDLLEDNLDNKEKVKNYIRKIQSANSMLLSLVNYILEMARIESGKIVLKQEIGNLETLVDALKSVSEPLISEKKIDVVWNLDVVHYDIICDITKIREIILNIVSNAIKYTPECGFIHVAIQECQSERSTYAKYQFIVADSGVGMSEEYLPHIFEEFSREHTSTESHVVGAGLGLPIVKSLVDLMHGEIQVKSHVNEGTCFIVTLSFPIYERFEQLETEKENHKEFDELEGKHILLAEDNPLNTEIAIEILKKFGIIVDSVENGKACLEKLNEKEEGYYDAVLMDIQMPVMNGYETTENIRNGKRNSQIPIVAMTANAFEEDRQKAMSYGMNGHIAKPISVENVYQTLLNVIKR